MKVEMIGGPDDGLILEVLDDATCIVIPLPPSPIIKPPSTLTPTMRLPRAELGIFKARNGRYFVFWEKRKEYGNE